MSFLSFLCRNSATETKQIPTRNLDDLKNIVKILFVDDQNVPKAKYLQEKDGWRNVQKINDIKSLSQAEVRDAHIIFIDIQGVGKSMEFQDEGLGLIVALKKTYPDKKIVMYSAESQGKIDAFHHAADVVDGRLRKGADMYDFSSTTERLAQEAFCLDNCVRHVKDVLKRELNVDKTEEEIKALIQQINDKGIYNDTQKMAEVFNLSNIGSVASIIQLLLMPLGS